MRALLLALAIVCVSGAARAEPVRLLLAVGARRGAADEVMLRYSVDDARRVREVFVALGGVRKPHAILLSDPSVSELRAAFDRMQGLARGYAKGDVTFVFYFSGHGDSRTLHVSGELMPVSELTTRIEGVPAALRIAIMDACRTVRLKGASAERAFAVRLPPSTTATGTAFIHAAADGEAAQESDALGGAVFTHYLVSGLRGAADRDGDRRVTLAEAYAFSHHLTLYRSARGAGTLQRPAAALELEERAPVVLTETTPRSAVLALPRGADTQYLVYATGARSMVAEIWGAADRSSALALTPGRYLVHRRIGSSSAVADVVLASGERRDVRADGFRPVKEEDVRAKGGTLILHPHALGASYGVRAGSLVGLGDGGRLLYALRFDDWAAGAGLEGGLGAESVGMNDVGYVWAGGELRLERRAELGPVDARFGVRVTLQYGWQTLTRKDAKQVQRVGYSTEQHFAGIAAGGGLVLRALLPLSPWFIELGGTLDALGAREGEKLAPHVAGGFEAGGGVEF